MTHAPLIRRSVRVLLPAVLAAGLIAVATACSQGAPAPKTPPSATSTAEANGSGTPSASPAAKPAASNGPLTCDTLITPDTVAALKKQGWAAKQREFSFGPNVLPGGLQCIWADQTQASDHGLLYGWAPISASDAQGREAQLVAEGWIREDNARGVYITADPRYSLSKDDQGYGMTYLFSDGWVTVSDTKQGLVLIQPQR
ncbi:hypothetical protein [Microbacterium capsulatum]|uniref:Lipoprotein n=1 Tax=Microbacterium capsulatum TaxID=3041921 RepID=A0ABU0XFL1_9MICO|nr:hypothetical protein [Microbacterium sp. ASV81]MDQ4212480.1 hypothetical protein [Microbacterium sp. ASV81]